MTYKVARGYHPGFFELDYPARILEAKTENDLRFLPVWADAEEVMNAIDVLNNLRQDLRNHQMLLKKSFIVSDNTRGVHQEKDLAEFITKNGYETSISNDALRDMLNETGEPVCVWTDWVIINGEQYFVETTDNGDMWLVHYEERVCE